MTPEELRAQLNNMLGLVEQTGRMLANEVAVVEEFGGTEDDLRTIVLGHKRVAQAMIDAASRTRAMLSD